MRSRGRGAVALFGMLILSAVAAPAAGAAERLYGVTQSNRLVTFQSDSPGAIRETVPIKGLRGGEDIVGIDMRRSGGRLYGVSSVSRLYTISVRTGRARAVVPAAFGGPLTGSLGFDFGPGGNELRLVTEAGGNFRVNPDRGELIDADPVAPGAQPDANLSYAPGDPAGTAAPRVGASAYADTRLFGIDTARDTLVVQSPPDQGVLSTVGPLRVKAGSFVGFDVGRDGRAWAAISAPRLPAVSLYRIDLSSGRARSAAPLAIVGTFRGRGSDPIRALAAAGRVPDDEAPPRVRNRKLNNPRVSQLLRGRVLRLEVRCSEACLIEAQLLYRRDVVGGAIGVILGRPGKVTLPLKLTRKGGRIVRRLRPNLLEVGLRGTDVAGNSVQTKDFRRR